MNKFELLKTEDSDEDSTGMVNSGERAREKNFLMEGSEKDIVTVVPRPGMSTFTSSFVNRLS